MSVLETIIQAKMILLIYDFKDNPEGNAERARLRNIIKGKPFYAMMMNQSVYLISESVSNRQTIQQWANDTNADIKVFGNIETTIRDRRNLAKQYVTFLHDIRDEANETALACWKDLQEFEDTMDDKKASIRGWHNKINSVKYHFDEMRKLINRIGDDRDEFEMEKLASFVKDITLRYKNIKKVWEAKKKEMKK